MRRRRRRRKRRRHRLMLEYITWLVVNRLGVISQIPCLVLTLHNPVWQS
jgi:hypothetical protein